MLDNLNDYTNLETTTKCFTDGRYFNKVFKSYEGLIPTPLNINLLIDNNTGKVSYQAYMNPHELNKDQPGQLRIIINTPNSRHSNLLILDYRNNKVYRFEPYNTRSVYHDYINQIIQEYLGKYMDFELYELDNPLKGKAEVNGACIDAGFKSGFCVAYIIRYAYDYLTGQKYDPTNIRKFSTLLENKYKGLDPRYADIEYGLFGDDATSGILLGSLGGAAVGGLITQSPGGVLGGAALGGLLGYGLSK